MPADIPQLVLVVLIMTVATAVQASIGFGLAMIGSPLLLLVDPAYVPGPMLASALALSLWVAWNEWHAIDFSLFAPNIAGRLVGTPFAVLLLGTVSAAVFDLIFGLLVLLAVAMSLVHTHVQPTRRSVFLATVAAGFMGTLSGIGGPPLALVYQNSRGPELRANLAMLFITGTIVSIAGLSVIGRFGWHEVKLSLVLLLGVALGVGCRGPLTAYLDKRAARPYLLGLCAISACAVLLRALAAWSQGA